MESKRIVIIGGGIAGFSAALSARSLSKNFKITLLYDEDYPFYKRPLLPYAINNPYLSPKNQKRMALYGKDFFNERRIGLRKILKLKALDLGDRSIEIEEPKRRGSSHLSYDVLIIATGASSRLPKELTELPKKGVFTLRKLDDLKLINDWIPRVNKAIVVGAGLAALKIAEALAKRGIKASMLVRSRALRDLLEPELSTEIHEELIAHGVSLRIGESVEAIEGKDRITHLVTSSGRVETDMSIFAMGVEPNLEVAKKLGLELGERAIKVDRSMQTSVPKVYAAGDCCEGLDFISRSHAYIPIASIAATQGSLAGFNAAGASLMTEGFIRAQFDRCFSLSIAIIGYSKAEAEGKGIKAEAIELKERSLYASKKSRARMKIVVDEKDRLIGG
ncbi:MAG: FAD-dependent oxidoreductase, partial [Candidatus Bathyarchaeia archaeon]